MYVLLLLLTGLMSGLVAVQDVRADGCIIGKPSTTFNTGQKTREDYCDSTQNKYVTQGTTTAGEAIADDVLKVEMRGYYTSITTAATTVLKSGPGWMQGCKIVGGVAGNVTIYDNTAASGAVIVAAFLPSSGGGELDGLNASFTVGATVVTAGATNLTCTVR